MDNSPVFRAFTRQIVLKIHNKLEIATYIQNSTLNCVQSTKQAGYMQSKLRIKYDIKVTKRDELTVPKSFCNALAQEFENILSITAKIVFNIVIILSQTMDKIKCVRF